MTTFYSRHTQKTKAANAADWYTVKIKQSGQWCGKRSDIVFFVIFCSHYYRSKAKQ